MFNREKLKCGINIVCLILMNIFLAKACTPVQTPVSSDTTTTSTTTTTTTTTSCQCDFTMVTDQIPPTVTGGVDACGNDNVCTLQCGESTQFITGQGTAGEACSTAGGSNSNELILVGRTGNRFPKVLLTAPAINFANAPVDSVCVNGTLSVTINGITNTDIVSFVCS